MVHEKQCKQRFEEKYGGNESKFLSSVIYRLLLFIIHDKEKEDLWGLDPNDIELLKFLNFEKLKIEIALKQGVAAFFFCGITLADLDEILLFFGEMEIVSDKESI